MSSDSLDESVGVGVVEESEPDPEDAELGLEVAGARVIGAGLVVDGESVVASVDFVGSGVDEPEPDDVVVAAGAFVTGAGLVVEGVLVTGWGVSCDGSGVGALVDGAAVEGSGVS